MISIIICTYNRADSLNQTMDALQNLIVPEGETVELMVVDNKSKDTTRQVVESWVAKSRLPLKYLYEPEQGASHARNAGIKKAQGDMLCFFDDDVIVDSQWLVSMVRLFRETDVEMAGCRILRKWECEAPDWYSEEVSGPVIMQDFGPARIKMGQNGMYLISAGLAFRKEVFDRIGLFRGDLGRKGNSLIGGEDKELFDRVAASGGVIYYEPAAVIHHRVEENRLTQDYMRRWFYAIGQTAGHQLVREPHHRFSMAPLWAWGDFLAALFRRFKSLFPGKSRAEKFASEVLVLYTAAYLRECFVHWFPGAIKGCVFMETK